jgi:ABC-type nitrate/sulfonate/bicarbonate transport system substrate-binding protein
MALFQPFKMFPLKHLAAALLVVVASTTPGRAQQPAPVPHPRPLRDVRVITFGGASNLPIWAAQRQGFFADEGLEVRLTFTPNSAYQMTQLLAGNYDIAMTAIDNVVAYQEGQNEAPIGPNPDLVAFAGTDNAFLSLVSQGPLKSIASLRGHTLTVDAMTTGYAFVLRDLLERHQIMSGDVTFVRAGGTPQRLQDMLKNTEHAATIQGTPFEFIGELKGLNTLVRIADELGPYQGFVAATKRSWAAAHDADVVGYTRAMVRAIEWLYQPDNRPIVEALLIADIPGMSPSLAAKTYDIALAKSGGIFHGARPDLEGIRRVLALRTRYGLPQKDLVDPMKYLDLSYLARAEKSSN